MPIVLKKKIQKEKKKRIRDTVVLCKDARGSVKSASLAANPSSTDQTCCALSDYNPTSIYPFIKAVSGISRQTNKCPFLNKGIETIKDKSTYFYSANSRCRISSRCVRGGKTTFDSSKFSVLLIKSGKKISFNRTCLLVLQHATPKLQAASFISSKLVSVMHPRSRLNCCL